MRIKYADLQKCYPVKLGEALPVVLRPAASQDRCQGAMQGLEELRSKGEGSTERAVATHTLAQEVWAFARPSDQTRRFWFALFITYL